MSLFRRRSSGATVGATPVLVLVADDDPVVRDVLQGALQAKGFAVVAVVDGTSAVQAAQQYRPAVVVLDWLMPGMYGPQVCEALRADPATAAVPVLMLTTKGEQEEVEHALRSGADDYVTKPFHPREVLAVVQRLLDHPPRRP